MNINGAPIPVAFYAVVSIGVIGLYLGFAIPIYLRWRAGDSFEPGSWTLGPKLQVAVPDRPVRHRPDRVVALLPTSICGAPWYHGFGWRYVNYTILVVPGALILFWIYWHVSVKNWFTGPKHTIDLATEEALATPP